MSRSRRYNVSCFPFFDSGIAGESQPTGRNRLNYNVAVLSIDFFFLPSLVPGFPSYSNPVGGHLKAIREYTTNGKGMDSGDLFAGGDRPLLFLKVFYWRGAGIEVWLLHRIKGQKRYPLSLCAWIAAKRIRPSRYLSLLSFLSWFFFGSLFI